MGKNRVSLDGVLCGVEVLEERKAKAGADFIADGQEQ
jgi:hypothetical protein